MSSTPYLPNTTQGSGIWVTNAADIDEALAAQSTATWVEAGGSGAGLAVTITGTPLTITDGIVGAYIELLAEGDGSVVPAITINGARTTFDAVTVATGGIGGGSIPLEVSTRQADICELDPGDLGVVGSSFGNARLELIASTDSTLRIYWAHVVIDLSAAPSVVLGPLDASVPQIRPSWAFVSDAGLPQVAYRAVITNAAVGTVGDPTQSGPLGDHDTGIVESSAGSIRLDHPLVAASPYRAHVAAAERLPNGTVRWSDFATVEFAPVLSGPATPTFNGISEYDAATRRTLDIHLPADGLIVVERSADAGTTWAELDGWGEADTITQPAGSVLVDDDTAPLDVELRWRTKAAAINHGRPIWSAWTEHNPGGSPAQIPSNAALWLKVPARPANNRTVTGAPQGVSGGHWDHPTGVFKVLGRADPVYVTDLRNTATHTIRLTVQGPDELDAIKMILAFGLPLLLSGGTNHAATHLRFLATRSSFESITDHVNEAAYGYLTLDVIEIER